ncbi:hypothetical protein E3E31_12100 [Thermococcus sp. M39]|uniref:hypothetical protein n=1 Tax=Thermococcus sp. M39 TaxID=1638262 RepID=UPI00143AD905|nr:hypothetical protein [Thermococcus sp. M39]NJE09250.1 hypothetical protein [Thermococcus sp. M39]
MEFREYSQETVYFFEHIFIKQKPAKTVLAEIVNTKLRNLLRGLEFFVGNLRTAEVNRLKSLLGNEQQIRLYFKKNAKYIFKAKKLTRDRAIGLEEYYPCLFLAALREVIEDETKQTLQGELRYIIAEVLSQLFKTNAKPELKSITFEGERNLKVAVFLLKDKITFASAMKYYDAVLATSSSKFPKTGLTREMVIAVDKEDWVQRLQKLFDEFNVNYERRYGSLEEAKIDISAIISQFKPLESALL